MICSAACMRSRMWGVNSTYLLYNSTRKLQECKRETSNLECTNLKGLMLNGMGQHKATHSCTSLCGMMGRQRCKAWNRVERATGFDMRWSKGLVRHRKAAMKSHGAPSGGHEWVIIDIKQKFLRWIDSPWFLQCEMSHRLTIFMHRTSKFPKESFKKESWGELCTKRGKDYNDRNKYTCIKLSNNRSH